MARVPAGFAVVASVLVLFAATVISPGNGQFPLQPSLLTGCLPLPGDQFPSSLVDAYKFLGPLMPKRIIPGADTSRSVASDGKGYVVLAATNCADAKQLWVRDSFSPAYLNGTTVSNLTTGRNLTDPGGNSKPFALVNLGAIIDSKELQALEFVEKYKAYPNIKLAPYNPNSVPPSMLWTQDAEIIGDGFYKIRSLKYPSLILASAGYKNSYVDMINENNPEVGYKVWKTKAFLSSP